VLGQCGQVVDQCHRAAQRRRGHYEAAACGRSAAPRPASLKDLLDRPVAGSPARSARWRAARLDARPVALGEPKHPSAARWRPGAAGPELRLARPLARGAVPRTRYLGRGRHAVDRRADRQGQRHAALSRPVGDLEARVDRTISRGTGDEAADGIGRPGRLLEATPPPPASSSLRLWKVSWFAVMLALPARHRAQRQGLQMNRMPWRYRWRTLVRSPVATSSVKNSSS